MPVKLNGATSGSVTLDVPAVAGTTTLTLPTTTGTLVVANGGQTVQFAAGTASAPSITATGDTNNGIYFPATDTIAITTNGTEAMRIDSSGNVGIGRANSNGKLDVGGDLQVYSGSASTDTVVWIGNYNTVSGSGGQIVYKSSAATPYLAIDAITQGVAYRNIVLAPSGGNVGIATTSPATPLHVNGTIRYTNRPAAGTITAIGYDANGDLKNSSSSLRYKYDVQDYTKGLNTLMQLRPVSFKFNGEDRTNSGFIAEEVDALGLSEVMLYDDQNRPDGVLYSNMVALLTKAIQEQQATIATLEARIAALENA